MNFAYGETVTRLRGVPGVPPYNETDWSNPETLVIPGCGFDPGGSALLDEMRRTTVETKPTVYAPPGVDVKAGDRLVVRERTWNVTADPADWRSPLTGWAPGTVIPLEAVS